MRNRRPVVSLVASLVALAALTSACGDDVDANPSYTPVQPGSITEDPEEKADAQARAEAGDRALEGDGYWYVLPEGWKDDTRRFKRQQEKLDTASADTSTKEQPDNLGVWTALAEGRLAGPVGELAPDFRKQLAKFAIDIRRVKGTQLIDGRDAVHLVGQAKLGKVPSEMHQFLVISGGQLYVITFSLRSALPAKERNALIQQVFRSWHWL